MSDYDYIITVDENGSPCLSHAWGMQKGGMKKDHQWFARENVKGKWRYWYDPESYRRWASGVTTKAKGAVDTAKKAVGNAAGEVRKSVSARKELNEANKATGFGSGLKQWNAQRKYNKTAMGRAEKAVRDTVDDLGDRARGLATTAQGRTRQAIDETRNAVGQKAAEVKKTGRKKIKNLTDAAKEHGDKALSEIREAAGTVGSKAKGAVDRVGDKLGVDERKALDNANFLNRRSRQKAYDATPMGKAEKAAKGAADRVRDTADNARDTVADKASDIRDKIRGLTDSAASSVRSAASEVGSKAKGVADRVGDKLGVDEREALENANFLNRRSRQRAYDATPMGKVENAKKEIDAAGRKAMAGLDDAIGNFVDAVGGKSSSAISDAKTAAKKALAKAMDYLPDEQIEEIKDLIRGK